MARALLELNASLIVQAGTAHFPVRQAEPRVAVQSRGRERVLADDLLFIARAPEQGARMQFQDRALKCVDCGGDFVFTAGEQLFFHDKQFRNEPKRCKSCKAKRLATVGAPQHSGHTRIETAAVCSQCGKETTVPFRPTQNRPILCRECFREKREAASA